MEYTCTSIYRKDNNYLQIQFWVKLGVDKRSLYLPVVNCEDHSKLQIRCIKLTSIDSTFVISSPNPMFDYLLESSRWDDSNKWSNIGFGKVISIKDVNKLALSGALNKTEHSHTRDILLAPMRNRMVVSKILCSTTLFMKTRKLNHFRPIGVLSRAQQKRHLEAKTVQNNYNCNETKNLVI